MSELSNFSVDPPRTGTVSLFASASIFLSAGSNSAFPMSSQFSIKFMKYRQASKHLYILAKILPKPGAAHVGTLGPAKRYRLPFSVSIQRISSPAACVMLIAFTLLICTRARGRSFKVWTIFSTPTSSKTPESFAIALAELLPFSDFIFFFAVSSSSSSSSLRFRFFFLSFFFFFFLACLPSSSTSSITSSFESSFPSSSSSSSKSEGPSICFCHFAFICIALAAISGSTCFLSFPIVLPIPVSTSTSTLTILILSSLFKMSSNF
mmetsp:Transcript_23107/g.36792  ORF Transcript_23107/g.36792 Transcript_23107/m.36792 type:complete len:265 (-) Transcript_23107:1450-2244(-)